MVTDDPPSSNTQMNNAVGDDVVRLTQMSKRSGDVWCSTQDVHSAVEVTFLCTADPLGSAIFTKSS